MKVQIDPRYPDWLRIGLGASFSGHTLELVKTLPNRRFVPEDKEWQVPALPEVLDFLIRHFGKELEPMDYEVFRASFPAPRPQISASALARKRDKEIAKAKYGKGRR